MDYILFYIEYIGSVLIWRFSIAAGILRRIGSRSIFVGIANGYDGALSLIERIAEEAYEKTGEVNLRKFLLDRQEEFEKKEIRSV